MKASQKELANQVAHGQKQEEELQQKIKNLEKENTKIAQQIQRDYEKKEQQWLKEKESLNEQIEELKDSIESINLDKDLAEEARTELEKEVDTLRGKVEILEASRQSLSSASG